MTDQPKQDAIVSQRAREAAAAFIFLWNRDLAGRDELVQTFARFEAEIEAATIERCAGVCDEHAEAWGLAHATPAIAIATAIRNLKGQTS